jgi:RNA polymerase sigma-70 factor (ECF subfamily)
MMAVTQVVEAHRGHLFGIAYRMLGSAADAEDAVQEAFARWHNSVAAGADIKSDRAWLTTTVTRIALDELKSARHRRESYVGPWLPEPLVAGTAPDVADQAVLADSLSTAFMVMLERLSPKERAVFLLHDVFAYDFATIAGIVGETETYCRQIARRARSHIAEGRPRYTTPPDHQRELLEHFVAAYTEGNLPALIDVLAEDVTLWSDGGGRVAAALRPIAGRDRVIRFLEGIGPKLPPGTRQQLTTVNGEPGILTIHDGQVIGVTTFEIRERRVHGIYVVVNPEKLPPALGIRALPG